MIGKLLVRGLVAGLIAGLLAGAFAFAFGEPYVDRAIAIEEAAATREHPHPPAAHDAPPVGRDGQRVGLFFATGMYGLAIGGLFALAFAALRGRGGRGGDWSTATGLAALGLMAVVLVPALKYPANPPAVGDPGTIASRTALYLTLVAISLLGLLAAWRVARQLADRASAPTRQVAAALVYVATMAVAFAVLPAVNEVPAAYPADLLWGFRLSALGTQAVLWSGLGVLFGLACVRRPLAGRKRETGEFAPVPAALADDR